MFGCVCVNTTFRLPIAIVFLRKKLTDKPISNILIPGGNTEVWGSPNNYYSTIIILPGFPIVVSQRVAQLTS